MAAGGEGASLEYTPTWILALVCTVIVAISFAVERLIHLVGKYLLKKNLSSLFQALQKIKEELMLLGFISLLLTVCQTRITKICIPKGWTHHWLPCKYKEEYGGSYKKDAPKSTATTEHFQVFSFDLPGSRHLLAAAADEDYCGDKGKAPLLSLAALHHLHIFIFVLAATHVIFSALTILFGGMKIKQWKHWEEAIQKKEIDPEEVVKAKLTQVHDHAFVKSRTSGVSKFALFRWTKSFFKQFYGSVSKSDYTTLRLGFVMNHCKGNPKFNFYKYMNRAFENDFKKVVGISWYLWVFVVLFLLVNVYGWHAYFWISFVPLVLLLAVGTKLENIITQLAREVAHKHIAVTGDLVIKPSDEHFWFNRPRLVLLIIHILLFQNAFEISVFLWMLSTFGFDSCVMGEVGFAIPRLFIGVFVQFVCSYSTLPLYAIVAQMGSSFNRAIFDDHIQVGLVGWAQKAKQNKGLFKKAVSGGSSNQVNHQGSPLLEMTGIEVQQQELEPEKGKAQEIEPVAQKK